MGQRYDVICECGHRFNISVGGGFVFDLLYCDRCGAEKVVKLEGRDGEAKPFDPKCKCGGQFSEDAMPRCPECGSRKYQEAPNSKMVLYD